MVPPRDIKGRPPPACNISLHFSMSQTAVESGRRVDLGSHVPTSDLPSITPLGISQGVEQT
jgi:hypothetical protein